MRRTTSMKAALPVQSRLLTVLLRCVAMARGNLPGLFLVGCQGHVIGTRCFFLGGPSPSPWLRFVVLVLSVLDFGSSSQEPQLSLSSAEVLALLSCLEEDVLGCACLWSFVAAAGMLWLELCAASADDVRSFLVVLSFRPFSPLAWGRSCNRLPVSAEADFPSRLLLGGGSRARLVLGSLQGPRCCLADGVSVETSVEAFRLRRLSARSLRAARARPVRVSRYSRWGKGSTVFSYSCTRAALSSSSSRGCFTYRSLSILTMVEADMRSGFSRVTSSAAADDALPAAIADRVPPLPGGNRLACGL
uniref:Putative secreted protein n=1 Tax=Amblyomma triste TaxID=251400 RepID=A0A023G3D7_AMBTT